jgi:hypothetical protein
MLKPVNLTLMMRGIHSESVSSQRTVKDNEENKDVKKYREEFSKIETNETSDGKDERTISDVSAYIEQCFGKTTKKKGVIDSVIPKDSVIPDTQYWHIDPTTFKLNDYYKWNIGENYTLYECKTFCMEKFSECKGIEWDQSDQGQCLIAKKLDVRNGVVHLHSNKYTKGWVVYENLCAE